MMYHHLLYHSPTVTSYYPNLTDKDTEMRERLRDSQIALVVLLIGEARIQLLAVCSQRPQQFNCFGIYTGPSWGDRVGCASGHNVRGYTKRLS